MIKNAILKQTSKSIFIFLDDLLVDKSGNAHLRSHTVWGLLRGLESFTQSVYKTKESGYLVSNNVGVINFPNALFIQIMGNFDLI